MEEDREISNVGPTPQPAAPSEPTSTTSTPKQPRKRITGRRTANLAASTNTSSDATDIATTKPPRPIRTLHAVPDEILNDPAINAALTLLPANYNFEIHKTIHRIRTSGSSHIALQFPEGLLMFAPTISDILVQFCPGIETTIMGDVTYGACCIDDFTARALGCDLLVHYGHSCLVPIDTTGKDGLKVMYVFVTIGIDVQHLVATIERNFQPGKRMALVGTIQFNNTLHAMIPQLRQAGFDPILPRSNPLSAGEILGCTAPTMCCRGKGQEKNEADMILYVGDGRFHLESILIASPQLKAHTYRYDPYSRRLTHETYDHEDMHSLRRAAIRAARETLRPQRDSLNPQHPATEPEATSKSPPRSRPRTWGLILGTLGRQGNPHTLDLITAYLNKKDIPHITLLLSEVMPAKLALMSADVGVWVQVACPRLSIDWGYAFERPLLSPYEACVVLDIKEGGEWADKEAGHDVGALEGAMRRAELEDGGQADRSAPDDEEKLRRSFEETPAVYPMDYYAKEGLGRVRVEDVPG
ncbi:MAG: hypothetical protein Q9162_007163 [Coniocarpon cinnabarinum]